MRNNVLIGNNAGADLDLNTENVVIIGDDIRNLDTSLNKNVMFIGEKVAIGKTLFGVDINLQEVVKQGIAYKARKKHEGVATTPSNECGYESNYTSIKKEDQSGSV